MELQYNAMDSEEIEEKVEKRKREIKTKQDE